MIKVPNKIVNLIWISSFFLFMFGLIEMLKVLPMSVKDPSDPSLEFTRKLTIIATCVGFIVLQTSWIYKERQKALTQQLNSVQSFIEIMYKGPWFRWIFTIFTLCLLFWLSGGGLDGSLIGGSIYGAFGLTIFFLIFIIPLYLLDCYLKLRKQRKYINKLAPKELKRSFNDAFQYKPDKPKDENPH